MISKVNEKILVAIVDNSIDPSVYRPVEHWAKFLKVPFVPFRALDGRLPDLGAEFTHFILTGSESSILEKEPWVDAEVEFIKEAVTDGRPLLGSCYGHQLIALALGGPDRVRRCPRPEVGWYPIDILERSGLLGDKGKAHAFCSHFDETVDLGPDFRVLASTPECPIQAFELSGRPVWGIQFHPEIDIPDARQFLRNLVGLGLQTSPLFEDALAAKPRDSGIIRKIVSHFLGARARD